MSAADEEEMNGHQATDASDSNSADSSDNDDVNSDGSNEEVDDSAATVSSPVADGGNDRIADDESTEPAASIPDCTLWDVWPERSTEISVNYRNRSSTSSSSSSSSSENSSL